MHDLSAAPASEKGLRVPVIVTVPEASESCGILGRRIRVLCALNRIPSNRDGGPWVITVTDAAWTVDAYVARVTPR